MINLWLLRTNGMSRTKNTKSRDCAPTPEEMNLLMNACQNDLDRFILAGAGILGMDKGMIAHFKPVWVERTERTVKIPFKQACDIGVDDQPCSYCKKHGIIQFGVVYWHPKGRTLKNGEFATCRNAVPRYYGYSAWATAVLERFTASYTKFPLSARSINHVLDVLQKRAGLSHRITVHGLRSFAASNYCELFKGDTTKINPVMGWARNSTESSTYIEVYNLRKALDEGKGLI